MNIVSRGYGGYSIITSGYGGVIGAIVSAVADIIVRVLSPVYMVIRMRSRV